MAPVLTLGWQLHTYAALVSLSYYPLGAKSHSGQWAESQCEQHQRNLRDRSALSCQANFLLTFRHKPYLPLDLSFPIFLVVT